MCQRCGNPASIYADGYSWCESCYYGAPVDHEARAAAAIRRVKEATMKYGAAQGAARPGWEGEK